MSQNIDKYLNFIIFEGVQTISQLLNLKQLQFANPNLLKRQQPNSFELVELNKKSKLLSEDAYDWISELIILLQQCKFETVKTKVLVNIELSLQLKKNYKENLILNTTDKNFVVCIDINSEHKQTFLKSMYGFINWIVLHQKGLSSFGEEKQNYIDIAHIQIFEAKKQLILIVGYNKLASEIYVALSQVRFYNYLRNKQQIINIPEFRMDTFCSILYHYVSIFRKILGFSDTKRYDSELKQLISANAAMLIENPQKQKFIPCLGQFDQCDFILFDLKITSQSEFEAKLDNYQYLKQLVSHILMNLKCLFVRSKDDMAYSFVLSGQYLLITFQYNNEGAILLQNDEQLKSFIEKAYKFIEIDSRVGIKNLILHQTEKQIQKEETLKTQRNKKIAELISQSVNTAFSWYDQVKVNKEKLKQQKSLTPRRQ